MGRQIQPFPAGLNSATPAPTSAPDLSAILLAISQSQMQSRTHPQSVQQQPGPQAPTSDLEAIFAQHAMKTQPVPQMHMQQTHAPQVQIPQMQTPQSFQASQHPATTYDVSNTLSAFQTQNQAQAAYGHAALLQIPDLRGLLSQFAPQPQPLTTNYAYGTGYQNADNERKRQLDYDDSGNRDYQAKGKRQKSEAKKKV